MREESSQFCVYFVRKKSSDFEESIERLGQDPKANDQGGFSSLVEIRTEIIDERNEFVLNTIEV